MICIWLWNSRQFIILLTIQTFYTLALKGLRKRVNANLAYLHDWLCANRLSLNAGKSEFIVFRPAHHNTHERLTLKLHQSKLFESQNIRYLGLILDNKLDWKAHITELSKKLSRLTV